MAFGAEEGSGVEGSGGGGDAAAEAVDAGEVVEAGLRPGCALNARAESVLRICFMWPARRTIAR